MILQVLSLQMSQYFEKHRRQIALLIAAGLTGCMNVAWNQDMTNTENHFRSFPKYFRAVTFSGRTIPRQVHESYPTPVFHQGRVKIAYMICPYLYTFGHPNKIQIWPPDKVAWLDPVSGKLVDEEPVTPDYFGRADSADKPLQINGFIPSGMTVEMYDSLEDRLFVLYDVLFEAWVANPSTSGHDKLRDKAREALEIFNQTSEKSLRPYYEVLGRDWFGWLRALAQ